MKPLLVTNFTATSSIGRGRRPTLEALLSRHGGLAPCRFETVDLDTHVGEVPGLDAVQLPAALRRYDCRNNRLAELALQQDDFIPSVDAAARRFGATRIGVFIGTSTAGILETELAYRARDPLSGALPAGFDYRATHNSFSAADFVRRRLELRGPAVAVACACASSAKVFGAAQRMIEARLIDAAVVGGVDSLCLTTLYGFHSLQLCSATPCRPFDTARDGISIGEAGAYALLERVPGAGEALSGAAEPLSGAAERLSGAVERGALLFLGIGESSDAYHMSSPHPDGQGARRAMQAALRAAHLAPEAIDYINLHGTGTPSNDRAESRAVTALFGPTTPCSSTKGATGHALGAAGALEAVISGLALAHGVMPGGVNTVNVDPTLTAHYLRENRSAPLGHVLSNSFGFGGANCSLVFGRAG